MVPLPVDLSGGHRTFGGHRAVYLSGGFRASSFVSGGRRAAYLSGGRRASGGHRAVYLSVCLNMDIYFRASSARASLLVWLHLPLQMTARASLLLWLHFLFDPLPEHRCFYGFTSSSSVCPSIAAFMASLPLRPSARASLLLWPHFFDPLPEHRCFYGFTSSSTVCPSIAAFMALLPLRPSARASLLLWLHLPLRPSARAVVADFRRFCGFSFPIWGPAPDHGITFGGLTLPSIVVSGQLCHGHDVTSSQSRIVTILRDLSHEPS